MAYEVNEIHIQHHDKKTYYSLRIKKSKTDQLALGRLCPIRYETYQALTTWLDQAKFKKGFLLRGIWGGNQVKQSLTREQVKRFIKRFGRQADLPPETIKTMRGHSLRVGCCLRFTSMWGKYGDDHASR